MKKLFRIGLLAAAAIYACTPLAYADGEAHDHMHMPGMAAAPPHDHAGASAIGRPGEAGHVNRTVTLDMRDNMRFSPQDITVNRGDTVRFVIRNAGKIEHEMVLGSAADLKAHAQAMQGSPGMQHAEDNAVSLAPDRSGQLIWQFTKAGVVDFACLEPGHFEAGMKGRILVREHP